MAKSIYDIIQEYMPNELHYQNMVAINPCVSVKKAVQEKNLSIDDLSKLTGISKKEIKEFIYKGHIPSDDDLAKIAKALNLSAKELQDGRLEYMLKRRKILNVKYDV